MKSIFTTFIACSLSLSVFAKVDEGYYRVQNYMTERYIYVTDDKGSLNFQATTAELNAIELWKGYENTISDPASVIFVKDLKGNGQDYDFQTQGTGVYQIISYPVSVKEHEKLPDVYRIFGRNSGLTRYIGDGTNSEMTVKYDRGYPTSVGKGSETFNFWYFHKITTDDSQYFGVKPEFQVGDEYYTTLYAGFPFSFASNGMKAYTISKSGNGLAALKEVTGTVAQGTPIIIKCSSPSASGNKLNIGGSASAITDNLLKGVYFNNPVKLKHNNQTPYDRETMRLLGKLSDGSIGFVASDTATFLPRNRAYLVVPAGSPDEIKLVTEAEYEQASIISPVADESSAYIENKTLYVSSNYPVEVYTITGQLIGKGSFRELPLPGSGIYIVKTGSKVYKLMAK